MGFCWEIHYNTSGTTKIAWILDTQDWYPQGTAGQSSTLETTRNHTFAFVTQRPDSQPSNTLVSRISQVFLASDTTPVFSRFVKFRSTPSCSRKSQIWTLLIRIAMSESEDSSSRCSNHSLTNNAIDPALLELGVDDLAWSWGREWLHCFWDVRVRLPDTRNICLMPVHQEPSAMTRKSSGRWHGGLASDSIVFAAVLCVSSAAELFSLPQNCPSACCEVACMPAYPLRDHIRLCLGRRPHVLETLIYSTVCECSASSSRPDRTLAQQEPRHHSRHRS